MDLTKKSAETDNETLDRIWCPCCAVTIAEINNDDNSSTYGFGHTISLTPTHSDVSKENDDCTIDINNRQRFVFL